MKRHFLTLALGLCLLLAGAQSAMASGFALYEWSARGNALGGTLVGRADDASAIAFNPAGITQLEGTHIQAGFSAIRPMAELSIGNETTKGADNTWLPPHAYVTHKLNDKWSIGAGVFSRFGLGTEYEEDHWPGSQNIYYAAIQTVSFAPTIAYKISDTLSIGGGIEFMHVSLEMKKDKFFGPQGMRDATLDAEGDGVGFHAGLHWKPNDQWRVGLSYRSQIEIGASGTQKFDPAVNLGFGPVSSLSASGTVVLPDMIAAGITYYPMQNLSIEVAAMMTRWSTYNEFRVTSNDLPGDGVLLDDKKDWNDVMRYSVGVEYGFNEWLDLRAGYVFDESPVEAKYADYIVPGNDRHLFNVGAGFKWNRWTADVSYTYLWMKGRDFAESEAVAATRGSAHDSYAHIYGITVGYQF
ncbi:OmpP1/FadL family transporter [Oleidesulfovibrio sp.]|uniref:OmpP1/FadL family transporter n=1 Tax=Oleidesulfovibrio sp. TaxID=2909707 RepID=UPI003A85C818